LAGKLWQDLFGWKIVARSFWLENCGEIFLAGKLWQDLPGSYFFHFIVLLMAFSG
jgi:hypothetical protein